MGAQESSQYDEEATKEAFHDCKEEFQDCKSRISSRNSKSRISPHSDVDSDFKTATEGGSDLEIDDMVRAWLVCGDEKGHVVSHASFTPKTDACAYML